MSWYWTCKSTLTLIEGLRNRPLLWNSKDPDYKHRLKKNQAWESLAAELNVTRRDVELKLHNLRSQFRRELNKEIFSRTNGLSWTSKWFAFDALKFLVDKDTALSASMIFTAETLPEDKFIVKKEMVFVEEEEQEDQRPEFSVPEPVENYAPEPEENYVPETEENNAPESTSNTSRSFKRKWKDDSVVNEDDECSIYGKYVTSELRSLNDEHSMIMAKHYISIILTKARLGKYRQKEAGNSENDSL